MRHFFALLFLSFSLSVFAETKITAKIHDLEISTAPNEPALIFLSTGLVAKWLDPSTVHLLTEAKSQETWLIWTLNEKREVQAYAKTGSPHFSSNEKSFVEPIPYTPTLLPSLEEARALFANHRMPKIGETQCYNRAEVWTFEWRKNKNVYSEKSWLFFTKRYIRKFNFEWWFHVSPMVQVVVDGKIKQRVMDMKYARGPLTLKQWTNIFMKDDADCPVVERYSEHANFPESGSCFLQKSSMYFYQPIDLENFDRYGSDKSGWIPSEILEAYREAFNIGE